MSTDPRPSGYGTRHERRPPDALSVPYASFELAVGDLTDGDRSGTRWQVRLKPAGADPYGSLSP